MIRVVGVGLYGVLGSVGLLGLFTVIGVIGVTNRVVSTKLEMMEGALTAEGIEFTVLQGVWLHSCWATPTLWMDERLPFPWAHIPVQRTKFLIQHQDSGNRFFIILASCIKNTRECDFFRNI